MPRKFHSSKGKTTGLTKTDFLMNVFSEQRRTRYCDDKIIAIFKKEFPWCASLDYSARIPTIRNQYNRGVLPGQSYVPKTPCLRYDSLGLPFPQRRGPAPLALTKRRG